MRYFKVDKRKTDKTQLLDLIEVTYRRWIEADELAGPKWPVSKHNAYQAAKAEAYLSVYSDMKEMALERGLLTAGEITERLTGVRIPGLK